MCGGYHKVPVLLSTTVTLLGSKSEQSGAQRGGGMQVSHESGWLKTGQSIQTLGLVETEFFPWCLLDLYISESIKDA